MQKNGLYGLIINKFIINMKSITTYIIEKINISKDNIDLSTQITPVPGYKPTLFKDRRKTPYSDSELLAELFLTWAGWFNGKTGINGSNPRAEKISNELYRKYGSGSHHNIQMPYDKVLRLGPAIAKACNIHENDFRLYQKSPKIQKIAQEVIELNMDWLLNGIYVSHNDELDDIKLP